MSVPQKEPWLYIFDLDNTLHLGRSPRKLAYEQRLIPYLRALATENIMTVASFNTDPEAVLEHMTIRDLFSDVISDTKLSKAEMVQLLMKRYSYIPASRVVFLDDDIENVLEVRKLGVKAVNVAPLTGIPIPISI